ncbi:MAG: AbrB/MazE/SpoVT family DNA-binding domain-containing protein [Betaproteobacteria bacterium]|nr:MAG: AbrB/MazE/SpoVT family DNA-binding domain-containing protein [Betaproteobacteria bacterium]
MEEHTVVSSKGQVVIPKALREAFGWEHGTRLTVAVDESGIVLRTAPTKKARVEAIAKGLQSLSGMLGQAQNSPAITDDDIATIVRARALARNSVRGMVKAKGRP